LICEEKRLIETLLEQQRNCFLQEREKGDNTPALFIEKNASAVEQLEWKYFLSALRKQAALDAFFPRPLAGSSFLLSSWQEIMGDLQVDVQLRESAIPPPHPSFYRFVLTLSLSRSLSAAAAGCRGTRFILEPS
jgi:hypothetical protein